MRILILSDIHGNLDALKAVLAHVDRWDEVFVLGDLVDYGPEPHHVIDIIKELRPKIIVRGNHDHAVAFNADCRCRSEIHDISVYTRKNITMKLLSHGQMKWLASLPLRTRIDLGNAIFYIVHGAPADPLYGYVEPKISDKELREMIINSVSLFNHNKTTGVILLGHTHIPFLRDLAGIKVFNPGSIGQPRDGDARASYGILDLNKNVFKIYKVEYPVERTIRKLESFRLDKVYLMKLKKILLTGVI